MSMPYRSGLMFRPRLANGGHGFVVVRDGDTEYGFDKARKTVVATHGERPTIWQCISCLWIGPTWMLTERFYARPCMGAVRALAVPVSSPGSREEQ